MWFYTPKYAFDRVEGRSRSSDRSSRWSRGPNSIFGPIFKVEDRAEDPNLRIAERGWWPLVEGGVGRRRRWGGFFDLRVEKVEHGGFFVLPAPKIDGGVLRSSDPANRRTPPSSKNPPSSKKSQPPRLLSDLRRILRGRRSKMGGFFDLRSRRSKIEDGGRFFDLRLRRSKMSGGSSISGTGRSKNPHLRSSEPENRRTPLHLQSSIFDPENRRLPPIFILRPRKSKNSLIFDLRSRKFGRRSPSAPWCFDPSWASRIPARVRLGMQYVRLGVAITLQVTMPRTRGEHPGHLQASA